MIAGLPEARRCHPGLLPAKGLRSTWADATAGPVRVGGGDHRNRDSWSLALGTKKTGKGRRKLGRKKRRMRSKIRHRKK
jgi:hypothetical protein